MKLIMENWKRFVNEEADPNKLDPNMFPLKLSDVEPKRANFLSRTGTKDEQGPTDRDWETNLFQFSIISLID